MDYKKAINFIVSRRREDLAEADAFFKRLLSARPEFRQAELALRAAQLDFAKGKGSEKEVKRLEKIRDDVIDKLGVREKLYPSPHCKKCGDTGRTGKEICGCVKKLAIETRGDCVQFPMRLFEDADFSVFSERDLPLAIKTAAELKAIALKGAEAKRKNINLLGKTGTGKTYFASCFAGESSLAGRTVVFITAFSFVDRALKYHTSFTADKAEQLSPLLDADVLIIDDLGTESMLKNVTAEYLYHVINERQLNKRTTLITSNLSIDEIAIRYGERTASRLFDKKLCYTREFDFKDIRKIDI